MAGPKAGILQPATACSVCLEAVNDASERSIAKLICGHQFHLDCIGSAFNAKGSMQCPNCRRIENGQWLYANGGRQREDSFFEDLMNEEEYDVFAGVSELLFPHDLMQFGHIQWCPYQGSYTQLSLSLGDADHRPTAHTDLVVNVLVGENLESSESLHPCPFVLAQAPALTRHVEENMRAQESSVRPQHQGAPHRQQFPPLIGQWGHQAPAVLSPIGVVGGVGLQEGSRWPQIENQSAGHMLPPQARYHGSRRRSSASTRSVASYPTSQSSPRPASWDYAGTSALQNAVREPEPRNNAVLVQRRQEGASAFRPYPSEPEGQRWAPPPLSGLYGAHGILGSELPTQVGFGGRSTQFSNQMQATFGAFQPYHASEDVDVQPSSSFYPQR